ncbi:MAG: DoxX family membrane protein [Gemmatimonadota bacterium]
MSTPPRRRSRWTLPVLRAGMGLFLALWGVDKLTATEGALGIFSDFYGLDVGALVVQTAGVAEILLGVLLAVGLFRVPMAWLALAVNAVSTLASWRQLLDPWGWLGLTDGGTHLFLASIVVMAVNVVLVLEARDDTLTLDAALGRSRDAAPGGA